ncbi:hypothetical protein HNY73_022294 [Argiope bruennichi]|uniref:Uncharacterized protein n=1 Tax=Argiope bruennichi TaxID=94029 RepID=A0A8T0E158_ARGBR|nr:hypothetical protein HNY73_022294 [Argiope bruennichi]
MGEGPKKKKQDFNRPKDSEPERMNDAVARRSSWDERREVREKKKEGHKIPDSPVKQSLGKGSISSPVLHSLMSELKKKHKNDMKSLDSPTKTDAIEELHNAFELAERSYAGISDLFVKELFHRLLPSYGSHMLQDIMEKLSRDGS